MRISRIVAASGVCALATLGCAEMQKTLPALQQASGAIGGLLGGGERGGTPSVDGGVLGSLTNQLTRMSQSKGQLERAAAAFDALDSVLLIGAAFAKLLGAEDQRTLYNAQQRAGETDSDVAFEGSSADVRGSVRIVADAPRKTEKRTVELKVLKDSVDEMPAIELVAAPFSVARDKINVRAGPGTDYRTVQSLARATVVQVIGKVRGAEWFVITRTPDGAASGFVYKPLLEKTSSPVTYLSNTSSAVTPIAVETTGQCKTVQQDVTTPDGTASEQVEICPQGDGSWKLAGSA